MIVERLKTIKELKGFHVPFIWFVKRSGGYAGRANSKTLAKLLEKGENYGNT